MLSPRHHFPDLLFDHAARLRRASGREALERVLIDFASAIGFDRLVVCSVVERPPPDPLIDRLFLVHGDWGDGDDTMDRETYLLHCPITRHILEQDAPFFWSKQPATASRPMRYRLVRHARDLGQVNGIQVPVFGRQGLEGAISMAGPQLDPSADLKLTAQAFCTAAYQALKVHQLPRSLSSTSLTPREREILRWVAAGRQQGDIAILLGISERTVENHLRSARQRLGASSTAQVVALALRLGELDP